MPEDRCSTIHETPLTLEGELDLQKLGSIDRSWCDVARRVGVAWCSIHERYIHKTHVNVFDGTRDPENPSEPYGLCDNSHDGFQAIVSALPLWRDEDLPKLLPVLVTMYVRERRRAAAGEHAHLTFDERKVELVGYTEEPARS